MELKLNDILVYYDEPLLFSAKDSNGFDYLCLLITESQCADQYLAIRVSENVLWKVNSLSLRELFASPEFGTWYIAKVSEGAIIAQVADFKQVPEEYLPE